MRGIQHDITVASRSRYRFRCVSCIVQELESHLPRRADRHSDVVCAGDTLRMLVSLSEGDVDASGEQQLKTGAIADDDNRKCLRISMPLIAK